MSQFGMQMPGGRARRGSSLDVFTVLAFLAVVALAVACGVMWMAASKVGKNGNPFEMQEKGNITLPEKARV
ncbi:MAG: hypothetical protein KF691_07155 [Phycisphaeraceae bacterium]|nr:hypothetical protein [Phycisphaeraceae bacterium]